MGIFGVADGHGVNGEKVSSYLKVWIPSNTDALILVQKALGAFYLVALYKQDSWKTPSSNHLDRSIKTYGTSHSTQILQDQLW